MVMGRELSVSAQRVQEVLRNQGLDCEVLELPQSTRSAKEAAEAVGCAVAQIAKSIVFRTRETQTVQTGLMKQGFQS